jgi:CubicO group peptidase (beta-lactamase class C family)
MLEPMRPLARWASCTLLAILCIHHVKAAEFSEAATPDAAQSAHPLTADDLEDFLDRFIPEQLSKRNIAGAVIAVVHGEDVLVLKGYGFADVQRRIAMSGESTIVRPASISKLFTAIAVMQLVERGRLDLDRDVNEYVDFHIPTPEGGVPVTLRRLLTHRAGFEMHLKDLFSAGTVPPLLDAWLPTALPLRLFPNGDIPAYSNYGYGLAGHFVERVSGERFEDYVSSHILQPLGMHQSTFEQPLPAELAPYLARGYPVATAEPFPYFETITPPPAGGMSTTAADMSRFIRAVLSSPTEKSIQIAAPADSPLQAPLSLLGLEEDFPAGNRFFGKHGLSVAFVSEVAWLPAADFGIFVSYNSASAQLVPTWLLSAIADRYFKQPAVPPSAASSDLADTAEFAGAYESTLRSDSSFMRLFGLLTQQIAVKALPDGKIQIGNFTSEFQQVESRLFRAPDGSMVQFAKRGSNDFMHISEIPLALEWERVPWYRDARVVLPVVSASIAMVAATLLAWPIASWVRRRRNATFGNATRDRREYRWVRVVLGVHALACLAGALLFSALEDLTRLNAMLDPWVVALYICAWLAVLGAAVTIWIAIRFWRDKVGGLWARLQHSLLAVCCSIIAWFFVTWRIAGTTLNY